MFGIDMGPSSQEQSQYGALTSAGGFATSLGENDLAQSSEFMDALLSGDPTRIAQVLSPMTSAAKTSAQQNNKTATQFGGRSGGTAAGNAARNDTLHSDITNMIGGTMGTAASTLGSQGEGLLGTGITADTTGFNEGLDMQKQRANKVNDVWGSSADLAAAFLK